MEKKHGDAEIAEGTKASGRGFEWEYLAGSNLKSQLTYPNDAVVTWSYEPHRDLLTAVTNATYSTYVYANDLLGRRTSKNDEQYGTTSVTSSFPQTMFPMPTMTSETARPPKAKPTPPTTSTNIPPSTISRHNMTLTETRLSSRPRPACGQSFTTPRTAPSAGSLAILS